MSEYPEHIDQIDDFYRSQLADHEIEPPEGLWGKISLGAFETQSPEVSDAIHSSSISSSSLTNTQKTIALGSAVLLIVAGLFYFYTTSQEVTPTENNAQPSIEQPIEEIDSTTHSGEDNSDQKSTSSSSNRKKSSSTPTKEVESMSIPNTVETPVNETQEVVPDIPIEQKVDSIADIKTTQKAPKEKVKFKDKYKKEYQDSTRKIFVPGK